MRSRVVTVGQPARVKPMSPSSVRHAMRLLCSQTISPLVRVRAALAAVRRKKARAILSVYCLIYFLLE